MNTYESYLARQVEGMSDDSAYEAWFDKWDEDFSLSERGEDFARYVFDFVDEDGYIPHDDVEDIYLEWKE